MTNENEVKQLTDMVASFVDHISKKLPDDVIAKLEELASKETAVGCLFIDIDQNMKLVYVHVVHRGQHYRTCNQLRVNDVCGRRQQYAFKEITLVVGPLS